MRPARLAPALCGAAILLVAIAWRRGGEYDEFYSVFLVAGHPRPDWPALPFGAGAARAFYRGHAGFGAIATGLRRGDVHPPLYFWLLSLWRDALGVGLFRLRLLSVVETLGALALLGRIALRMGISPSLTIAITTLFYGFAYTGIVARDFALATLCAMAGTLLAIDAARGGSARAGFCAGALLGAACFSNYLASFTAVAVGLWLAWMTWRQWRVWLAAAMGGAAFLPAGLWFFLAQAGSRRGQFPPFRLVPALGALARDQAGALLGALPREVPAAFAMPVAAVLGVGLAGLLILVLHDGRRALGRDDRALLAAGFAAPPLGLLALGAAFGNQPFEMRYVWLGLPFAGLALAASLRRRPWALAASLAVGATSVAGLALSPATMQPAARMVRAAARLPAGTLVIVPFGNDGVGVPGPFVAAAPAQMHILVARAAGAAVLAAARPYPRIAVARIEADGASRALVPRLAALFKAAPCWHSVPAGPLLAVFANTCRERR